MTVEELVDMFDRGVIDRQRIFDFHGAMIEVYEGKKLIGGSLEKHHLGNFRYRTVKNWSLELGNLPTLRILIEPQQVTEGSGDDGRRLKEIVENFQKNQRYADQVAKLLCTIPSSQWPKLD